MCAVTPMQLTVRLHTILQRRPEGRVSQLQIELPEGATVADVAVHLEIRLGLSHLLLVVNGRVAAPDTLLADGDHVDLIPALSGGSPHRVRQPG